MLYGMVLKGRPGTLQERSVRRVQWQVPEGVNVVGEYWFPTDDRQSEGFRHLHVPAPCPSPKRLAVFRFVSEHSEFDERRLWKRIFAPRTSWRKLMRLWNAQLDLDPGWVYNDTRNFRRAFVDTRDSLFKIHN